MTQADRRTHYAPPERATPAEIAEKGRVLGAARVPLEIFDCVPTLMMVLDEHRQVILANRALQDHFRAKPVPLEPGMRPGEALGCVHSHDMEAGCGTSEACRECGACQAVVESQKGHPAVRECRLLVREGDQLEALDMRVAASPFDFEGRRFTILSLVDISHEKRRRALERIFFHDIMNTAWVVSGYANLLMSLGSEQGDDGLGRIAGAAQRLIDEIRSQRDLMAAEEGELEPAVDAVQPVDLAQRLAIQYQASPLASRRTVELAPSTMTGRILTDPGLLGRVLSNMLKNALEATPEGGSVRISVRSEGEGVLFQVHNPGMIPRPIQTQIFQRSFSTKGKERGLGTYSMKLLAENYLGGRVSFVSTKEEGTLFQAWLPLLIPERPPKPAGP